MNIVPDQSTGFIDEFSYTATRQPFYLEDILGQYGDPDFINIFDPADERDFIQIKLFYDTVQTIITLDEAYWVNDGYRISKTTNVIRIAFLNESWYLREKEYLSQQPWKGYGIYP